MLVYPEAVSWIYAILHQIAINFVYILTLQVLMFVCPTFWETEKVKEYERHKIKLKREKKRYTKWEEIGSLF